MSELGSNAVAQDLLRGASEIATFLGLSRRSVYHQIESGRLPVFRLGSSVCARKSVLLNWIEEQERQSLASLQETG